MDTFILALNGGSSSLKFALFRDGAPPGRVLAGRFERIGLPDPMLIVASGPPGAGARDAAEARRIGPFDPEHLPAEIGLIEALERRLPGLPQVACFDTAFHADLPRVARLLPIPRR